MSQTGGLSDNKSNNPNKPGLRIPPSPQSAKPLQPPPISKELQRKDTLKMLIADFHCSNSLFNQKLKS